MHALMIENTLTEENKNFYKDKGYLVAPSMMSIDAVQKLNEEALAITSGLRGGVQGLEKNDDRLTEEEMFSRYSAIHFPHKISSLMKATASTPKIAQILANIVSPNVKCLQSMYFIKAPGKKGQAWHQDEYFIPTRDRSLTGAWIALDDANEDNGCLWVIPGSHLDGVIRKRIPNDNDNYADLEIAEIKPFVEANFEKVEVKKGSVVFFNGYLLHMSLRNCSQENYRRALVFHYCSAESMLPWDLDGRIEPTQDFRDVFLVAGEDPYAYKGTSDIAIPFVRPDVMDFSSEVGRRRLQPKA